MKRKNRDLYRKDTHSDSDLKDSVTVSDDVFNEALVTNILVKNFDFVKK